MATLLLRQEQDKRWYEANGHPNLNQNKEGVGELASEEQRKSSSWTTLSAVNQVWGNLGI